MKQLKVLFVTILSFLLLCGVSVALDVDGDSNDKLDMVYGGTNTATNAWTGLAHFNSGTLVEVDTPAELEDAAGLGGYMDTLLAWTTLANMWAAMVDGEGTAGQVLTDDGDGTYTFGTAPKLSAIGVSGTELVVGDTDEELHIQGDGSPNSDDDYTCFAGVSGWPAGESIAFGQVVYMDGTANEWMLADATAGTNEWPAIGFAVSCPGGGGDAAFPCLNAEELTVCLTGVIRNDGWSWTNNGKVLYVDEVTSGGLTETAPSTDGDLIQVMAISLDDDHIVFPVPAWGLDDGS